MMQAPSAISTLAANEHSVDHIGNACPHPAVCVVPSTQAQLEVVVGQSFGKLAGSILARYVERNRFDRCSDEASHECEFLLRRELAQNPVAFSRYVHWNLIRHLDSRRP